MASSNRHWPSMFKSKPCNNHHHLHHHHNQWLHEVTNPSSPMSSTNCHRTSPYSSVSGSEERTPEPKPRWNPKPEQIRILESIFNSGMVNPPRDEIRKIRAQLQEYGQVGDANVFYWFQNRKSRSKHKLRNHQNSKQQPQNNSSTSQQSNQISVGNINPNNPTSMINTTSMNMINTLTPPSSSSSSSEKSSPRCSKRSCTSVASALSLGSPGLLDASISSPSPTGSVNQTYYHGQNEFLSEPFLFPGQPPNFGHGFFFSDQLANAVEVQDHNNITTPIGPCTSLLLNEMVNSSKADFVANTTPFLSRKAMNHHHDLIGDKNLKMLAYNETSPITTTHNNIGLSTPFTSTLSTTTNRNVVTLPTTINQIQGIGETGAGGTRSTVFINDVAFDVGVGPFNVREAFGEYVVLIHSSGQPVLTNEWGITLHSLQHGHSYYLVPFTIGENHI